jgi:surface protein
MKDTFFGALRFNNSLGEWDVSRVTNMMHMFLDASSFNQDLGDWNVGKVTNMGYMFRQAQAFNGNIENWNVESVTFMVSMFDNARSFSRNITGWTLRPDQDVAVSEMFTRAPQWLSAYTNCGFDDSDRSVCTGTYATSSGLFDGPPGAWQQLPCAGSLAPAFLSSAALKIAVDSCLAAVPSGDNCCSRTINPADCGAAESKDMLCWNTSLVTSMEALFAGKASFNQNISGWDMSRVTNVASMFFGSKSFNQNLPDWNVGQVLNMENMFSGAQAFNGNIVGWNVNSVSATTSMFQDARSFNQNITGWTFSRQDMTFTVSDMFMRATEWLKAYTNCGFDNSDTRVCTGTYRDSSGLYNGPPGAWVQTTCDASDAPLNGAVGDCTDTVPTGSTCTPTCKSDYALSGSSSCSMSGLLTVGTCVVKSSPSLLSVGATYTLDGYTEDSFGAAERTAFIAAMAKLLALSPVTVRITRIVNRLAAGRRRLTQVAGVDVDFVVDVSTMAAVSSMRTQLDAFGTTSRNALVTELKAAGLSSVTDVTLGKNAATNAPPPETSTPSFRAPPPILSSLDSNINPPSSSSSSPIAAIAGALAGFFFGPSFVLSIMACCCKPFLRRKLLQYGFERFADYIVPDLTDDLRLMSVKVELLQSFLAKQKLPRLQDITPEIPESDVSLIDVDVLGSGGYGTVFKGTHRGDPVAVKSMFGGSKGSAATAVHLPGAVVKMMRREATIICSLNHPNIVRVLGIVPERGWIVMELCEGGSLFDVLRDPDETWLDASEMGRVAAETATGIAYLHMSDVAIVHGDLKAGNVLLTKTRAVRICDFGMSEAKDRSKTMSMAAVGSSNSGGVVMTVAWSAPELFDAQPKSYATDVYALGLTLWEIYERQAPFASMPEAAVVNQVLSGRRPDFTPQTPTPVRELIVACWSQNPKKRPAAAKLAFILEDLSTSTKRSASASVAAARGHQNCFKLSFGDASRAATGKQSNHAATVAIGLSSEMVVITDSDVALCPDKSELVPAESSYDQNIAAMLKVGTPADGRLPVNGQYVRCDANQEK